MWWSGCSDGVEGDFVANIALPTLDDHFITAWNEQMATEVQRQRRKRQGRPNFRLVRYADDFVVLVTGQREHAEQLRTEVANVLSPMGLRLSPEKTRAVHIDDGFDFLGLNIRRMRRRGSNKWFVYTKPSKKAIASIKDRVRTMTYRATLHHDPGCLFEYLGRVLRGWANFFRHGVSKATFSAVDSYAWERITAWLRDRHKIGWPRVAAQVLPARDLAARRRRATVPGRSQRLRRPVPLSRLPDPDPVDTDSHHRLSNNHLVESPVR